VDSSRIEIIIQKLLQDHDATYVADDLLKKWDSGELSEKDQDIAAQFLINTGFLQTLQNHFAKQLTQDRYIAWIPFLEMLSRQTQALPDEIVDPILVGMTENNRLEHIIFAQSSEKLHPRFKKLIKTFLFEREENLEKEKIDLKEKLQRHIHDRLDNEVQKLSLELRQKFPNDKEILEMTSDIDMARIKTLVQKKERDIQQILPHNTETVSAEDKNKLSKDVIKNAKKNPEAAYDLAILLTQMEVYPEALECLSYGNPSIEKDWLHLDLLIKCGNFIDAITDSFEIEKKYPDRPDTIISTLEYRAQALHGLGEKEKAIQILEKVLEVAPKNYSAKVLLHSWRSK
jgi:tetratricopeptide (TPR) repeat protein